MRGVQKRDRRGNAIVELALIGPWIFFLFIGVLDFGFYSYAAIATQNAARVAALAGAADNGVDNTAACTIVRNEMNQLPNTRTLSSCNTGTCPSTTGSVSSSQPLAVTVCAITETDGTKAVRVIVTYQSLTMIPIPGVVTGQLTMTRAVDAPLLNLVPSAT